MSADDEKHHRLIKHLEEYATKADADYETAANIFDLRWNTAYRRLNEAIHSSQQALDAAAENVQTLRRAIVTRRQIEIYFATINARNGTPPKIAEFCLAALLSGAKADAIIGDLNERFQHDLKAIRCPTSPPPIFGASDQIALATVPPSRRASDQSGCLRRNRAALLLTPRRETINDVD